MDSVLLVMNSDEVVPHVPAHVYIEGPVASDSTICRVLGNVNRQSVVSERMSNPSSQVRYALRDATFTMTFAGPFILVGLGQAATVLYNYSDCSIVNCTV
eukprot:1192590-Prorocentrum_minimum.AAC.3